MAVPQRTDRAQFRPNSAISKQLKDLSIGSNLLSGPIPPELGNLTQLEELIIPRYGKLSGSIPPELGNLAQLEYLWLFENELTGSIPPELGNLRGIEAPHSLL